MTITTISNLTELLQEMHDQDYEDEALIKVATLFAVGKRICVYQNQDLGHHNLGHIVCCSWTEEDHPGEPVPQTWPWDTPEVTGLGWRYTLIGVLNP